MSGLLTLSHLYVASRAFNELGCIAFILATWVTHDSCIPLFLVLKRDAACLHFEANSFHQNASGTALAMSFAVTLCVAGTQPVRIEQQQSVLTYHVSNT